MSEDEESPQADSNGSGAQVGSKLEQSIIEVSVPAHLDNLPLLCAAVREFCAALPILIQEELAAQPPEIRETLSELHRFGTGPLRLPGSEATITAGYSHFVYSIELVLQEAATNIIRHGYGGETSEASLGMKLWVERAAPKHFILILELTDTAPPFDPTLAAAVQPNPLEPRESSYGIYLIQKLSDHLQYFRQDGKNHLKVLKYLSA
jgi:anti-sigma regulatory factor (Ser/Thr protein kinase)